MSYLDEIADVEAEFLVANDRYSSLQAIRSTVVSWEWSTWDLYPLEPHHAERNNLPKGRRLKDAGDVRAEVAHELDREGRCVLTLQGPPFERAEYETYFTCRLGSIRAHHFLRRQSPEPLSVTDYVLEGARVVRILRCGLGGNSIVDFEYRNDLVAVETVRQSQQGDVDSQDPSRTILYDHDERGLLAIREGGYYWYYRLGAKEFHALCDRARRELVESIGAALREQVREAVFEVALAYEEGFSFPPDTTAGLVSELADMQSPEAREAFRHAPSEWSIVLKYGYDAELMNKLNNLTLVSASKYRKLVSLLGEVALDLNRRIEEFIAPSHRAEGFLVVHSDFDGEDLARNEAALRRELKTLDASRQSR